VKYRICLGKDLRVILSIKTENKAIIPAIKERYRDFLESASPVRACAPKPLQIDLGFSGKIDNCPVAGHEVAVTLKNNVLFFARNDFAVEINTKKMTGSAQASANIYSVDSLLRVIFSWLSTGRGGFLIHSAGIASVNHASLFVGKTGAGKSTIAKKFARKRILSDELVLVKLKNNKTSFAYSTPFWGELEQGSGNLERKINRVYFLNKAPALKMEQTGAGETVKKLLANTLFFIRDKKISGKILETAVRTAKTAKFYNLNFPKNVKAGELCI